MAADDNQAHVLCITTALFFVWSVLTLAVRAWVKLKCTQSWHWDDSTIFAALVVALLHVILIFWSAKAGSGKPVMSLTFHRREIIEKTIYASQIFYVASVGLTRISTGLFIARLTRHGQQVLLAYALTALCTGWMFASILVIGLRGDLEKPWSVLDGSQTLFSRWLGVESSGLVIEVVLWGLCIKIIYSLRMPLIRRLSVLAILGCRLLLVPIVAIRLLLLSPRRSPNTRTYDMTAGISTEAILNFALVSACVSCLKPFLKPFDSEYVVSNTYAGSATWPAGSASKPRESYYKLGGINESTSNEDRKVSEATTTKGSVNSYELRERSERHSIIPPRWKTQMFRPDRVGHQTTISAHPRNSSRLSHHQIGSSEMIIRKTESWTVYVEDDQQSITNEDQDDVLR